MGRLLLFAIPPHPAAKANIVQVPYQRAAVQLHPGQPVLLPEGLTHGAGSIYFLEVPHLSLACLCCHILILLVLDRTRLLSRVEDLTARRPPPFMRKPELAERDSRLSHLVARAIFPFLDGTWKGDLLLGQPRVQMQVEEVTGTPLLALPPGVLCWESGSLTHPVCVHPGSRHCSSQQLWKPVV